MHLFISIATEQFLKYIVNNKIYKNHQTKVIISSTSVEYLDYDHIDIKMSCLCLQKPWMISVHLLHKIFRRYLTQQFAKPKNYVHKSHLLFESAQSVAHAILQIHNN